MREEESEIRKVKVELETLSLTGRLCYLFMCIEKYLTTCYPHRDWTPVADRCWQWTNVYWNEGCDQYAPVVPEYLFEFDDYQTSNLLTFDGNITEKEYSILKNTYAGITDGNCNHEINQVLMIPIHFNNACECTNFYDADKPTLALLDTMQQFLSLHQISFPDIERICHMTIEEKNRWGNFIDSRYLSIII